MSEPKRPSTLIQAGTICGHDKPLSDDAAKDVVDRVKEGGLLDMHDAWFIEEHAYAKTNYDKLLLETSRQLNMAFSMVLPNGATMQPTTNAPPWMNMFCSLAQRLNEGYRTSDIIKQLKDLEQLGAPTTALENSLINAHKNLVNLFTESAKLPKTTA
jgi:hypothetical protein